MYAYKIDENGFIIDNYLIDGDTPIPNGSITVQLPQPLPFYRTRWNGEEWVEGETEEEKAEREALATLEALKPTLEQLEQADFEIKSITLLKELEVI